MKLGEKLSNAAKVIDSTLVYQFKSNPSILAVIHKEQTRTVQFIAAQQANVKKALTTYGVR
jgi:hypothetical protein